MKAVTALLALGLLCTVTEARLSWQYGTKLRGLLQAQPLTSPAAPAANTAPAAAGPTPTQPAGAQTAEDQPTDQPAATTAAADPAAQPAGSTVADPADQPAGSTVADPADQPAAAPTAEAVESPAPQLSPGALNQSSPRPSPAPAAVNATPAAAATPPAAVTTAPANATTAPAAANATGPASPIPGKNLMVVMAVLGQDARAIYENQDVLKRQLAEAAGVRPDQVYFFNQTANNDARTGVTTMSLIMNVDCTDTAECAEAGAMLFNSSSRTKLTDGLARQGISLLPGTFQVYGVNSITGYKGNTTLYENEAILNATSAGTAPDYNATMARFNAAQTPDGNVTADTTGAAGMPLGNFTIPGFTVENDTTPSASASSLNPTQDSGDGNLSPPGAEPGDVAAADAPPAEPAPRSAAGVAAAGMAGLPLLVAAAALLL
ncbi:hypothetical protein COO60DRAFT_1704601 [Scenedesmus sp. NREL 46B-D3]|nr:hypothetical protein COO60DRAFT_1704601 [Scenedesmus sp. NREL 46B-D3]